MEKVAILEDNYIKGLVDDIVVFDNEIDAALYISKNIQNIEIVIEDINMALFSNFNLANTINLEDEYRDLAIVGISNNQDMNIEAIDALYENFDDVILLPLGKNAIQKRLSNAARSKMAYTFSELENILKELPSNIYLKDKNGKYKFVTHLWRHIDTGGDPNWSIYGKTDLEIRKNKANAIKAMESDRQILSTDTGTKYVIEEDNDGVHEFLELIKCPIHDKNGNIDGIIGLINDVTETQVLKMELEQRAKTDSLTHLLNKGATEELIKFNINTTKKENLNGALIMLDIDNFKFINDTYGHTVGDNVLCEISRMLKEHFRTSDIIGRVGGDEFMVFMKDVTDTKQVENRIINFKNDINNTFFGMLSTKVTTSMGISICAKDGNTFERLYKTADKALYISKQSGKDTYTFYE